MNSLARLARISLQNPTTASGMLPPPAPPPNFFASSRLICSSGLIFSVAETKAFTAALLGAFFSLEKFAGLGDDGRSPCRNTLSSR